MSKTVILCIPINMEDEVLELLESHLQNPYNLRYRMDMWQKIGDIFPQVNFVTPLTPWCVTVSADRVVVFQPNRKEHNLLRDLRL